MSVFYCEGCGKNVDGDWVNYYFCYECGKEYCEEHWDETFEPEMVVEGSICGYCLEKIIEAEESAKEDKGDIEYHRRAEEPGGLDKI